MSSVEIAILDVGHGNSTVIVDQDKTFVIDGPPGDTLITELERRGVKRVEAMLISHADQDHVGGAVGLLLKEDIEIARVFVNPDSVKDTNVWTDFRIAARDARENCGTRIITSLTQESTDELRGNLLKLEVLSPSPEVALSGVGGQDLENRRLTANTMSAVVRLCVGDKGLVLLAADVDNTGLQNLVESAGERMEAEVLVFPHHGGKPRNAEPGQFAREILKRVRPQLVVFSLSRYKHNNPLPGIVDAVLSVDTEPHIGCTQLSKRCAKGELQNAARGFTNVSSRGARRNACCYGSVLMSINEDGTYKLPGMDEHREFVATSVEQPLCAR